MSENVITYIRSRRGRLALTYFSIIAALTLVFSVLLFGVVSSRLAHPPQPAGPGAGNYRYDRIRAETLLQERLEAARTDLFITFVLFNILIDILGAVVSYYLAQATMKPIEESIEKQIRFVSDASHELRTPLTALQTANEVALRDKKMKIGEAKEVLEYNLAEVVKLRELSNALLGLARNDTTLPKESFNIQEAVSEAMQPVIPLAQAKKIAIDDGATKQMVVANMVASAQLVRILLENAINYSPPDTIVHVTVQPFKSHVDLLVSDQGVGIEKHLHEQIFERFFRADTARSSTNGNSGFGLGLAIARTLAEKQNLSVFVKESTPQKGTVFCVRFPKK